jgi:hypothetical protein
MTDRKALGTGRRGSQRFSGRLSLALVHAVRHGSRALLARPALLVRGEGMRIRKLILASIGLAAVAVILAGTGAFATASSGDVKYFGPVFADGRYQCAKEKATIFTTSPGYAQSENSAWTYSDCHELHNANAGWLGTQTQLIRGDGYLCGTTPWRFNSQAQVNELDFLYLTDTSCTTGHSYKAGAHGQYWNDNTKAYVKSSWINSPFQNL